jgi:hypothetical protein
MKAESGAVLWVGGRMARLCGCSASADGCVVIRGGRVVHTAMLGAVSSPLGSMIECHRSASEFVYEFGGDVWGFRLSSAGELVRVKS